VKFRIPKIRIPLWVTLLPLVAGGLGWWHLWQGYAEELRGSLAQILPEGTDIQLSGFPYRLEAKVDGLALSQRTAALSGELSASQLTVHRVPWQRNRQVLTLMQPDIELGVMPLRFARTRLRAPSAIASLHLEGAQIARLSVVWEQPQIAAAFLPSPARAEKFEAHFRDTPANTTPAPETNADQARADIVLLGEDLRFGAGSPVQLDLRASITAKASLHRFADWQTGGTLRVETFTLSDAGGEILRFHGSLKPDAQGGLQIRGEVATRCPTTLRAAVVGQRAGPEKRTRKILTLPVSGQFPQGIILPPQDPSRPAPPVRGQEADCPALR